MKHTPLVSLVFALSLSAARAQNQPYYNDTVVLTDSHPPIDAPAFINRSIFVFTNFDTPLAIDLFQNTLNYTNTATGIMASSSGFRFDTYTPSALPANRRRPASTFINEGTLGAGSVTVPGFGTFLLGFNADLSVNATNIVSPGTIQLGSDSLLSLHGETIDLSRATIEVQSGFSFGGVQDRFFPRPLDGHWGLNSSASFSNFTTFDPITFEGVSPSTPNYAITNRNYSLSFNSLGGTNFVSYLSDVLNLNGSNRVVRAVFVSNTNSALTPHVFFAGFNDIVEFTNQFTDNTGATFTNYLYVIDDFGVRTNFQLVFDGIAGASRSTFIPINYSVFQTDWPLFFGAQPETPTNIPFGTFPAGNATNQYAAYQAQFQALTEDPTETAGGDVTNMTGRIEIVANKVLDLSRARIFCQNSIVIQATNQFAGSELAQISSPYSDLSLRSGTGRLAITNLIEPIINRAEGIINLYSARWTNIDNTGITNKFWVLFVDAQIAPAFPSRVEDLTLRSTNALDGDDSVFVSDFFTVTRSFLIDATSLTFTTNGANAPSRFGAINVTAPSVVWSANVAPRLQFLTNYGSVQAANAAFFGGSRSSSNDSYRCFVNFGNVANFGSQIWADHFENHSNFIANGGYISLNHSLSATLADGALLAPANLISLSAHDLLITNHAIECGSSLTLWPTNCLDDGSLIPNSALAISNKNFWSVGAGLNLSILPPFASLLGTTVTNNSSPLANVINVWAGADRGPTPDGFRNNAALGHLILDGATNSTFTFAGTTGAAGSNALYVDCLEFTNFASALKPSGDPTNVVILPGMKVYYAQLLINGISFADRINETSARDGLGFYWISNYNCGFFSSTEYPYPDPIHPGQFVNRRVNTALATSCDIDSYGNSGSNNCTRTVAPVPVGMLSDCNLYPPIAAPAITQQPSSIAPLAGANDSLSLTATGPALIYQWRKGGSNLVDRFQVYGVHSPKLSFTGVSPDVAGSYDVVVANAAGSVTSLVATVTVQSPITPPTIALQPSSISPGLGSNAVLSVAAEGSAPMHYQWRQNGTNLVGDDHVSGVSAENLTFTGVRQADEGSYDVVVTNTGGAVTSSIALVTVLVPPYIILQPHNAVAQLGTNVTFYVTAGGSSPLTYQWQLNGIGLTNGGGVSGVTGNILTIANVRPNSVGFYSVVVRNGAGQAQSQAAFLSLFDSLTYVFSNTNAIRINDNGPASPYPSSITVGGVPGVVSSATVTVSKMSHSYPGDVQMLLVGPLGQKTILMSDAGGTMAPNQNVTFADGAPADLPQYGQLVSGTYRPTDYPPAETFPAPAPVGPYETRLSVFTNSSANGVWSLYVLDDVPEDDGVIAGGWSLSLNVVVIEGLAPTIAQSPRSQSRIAGESLNLSVTADGTPPLVYQWRVNGTNLTDSDRVFGADSSALTIASLRRSDAGAYTVVVTNLVGALTSAPAAVITVAPITFDTSVHFPDGSFELNLHGEIGTRFEIQASANLKSWKTISVFTNFTGSYQFLDPAAALLERRFYRAVAD